MDQALLRGERVRLAAVNPETDPEIAAAWSRDDEFQSMLNTGAPTLLTARSLKAEMAESQVAEPRVAGANGRHAHSAGWESVNMLTELFRGRLVRLACQDADKDGETLARWSRDSELLRLRGNDPAQPRTAKYYPDEEARHPESGNRFAFNIHALEGGRLIGLTSLWVGSWANGEGWVGIFIGERTNWGHGYGTDAMRVLLQYAFAELNLARVSLETFAANTRAIR